MNNRNEVGKKKKVDLPYVLFYFPTVFTKLSFTVTKHCEKTNTTTIHQHLQIKLSGSVTFFIFAAKNSDLLEITFG